MKSHSKMYLSRHIWIYVFIALQFSIKDVSSQDWLKMYPAYLDGFNSFATQGPEIEWGNQYNLGNQQVVGQQSQVNMYPNPMQEQTPVTMNRNDKPTVIGTSNAGSQNVNSQTAMLPVKKTTVGVTISQDNVPSQTKGSDTNATLKTTDNSNTFASEAGLAAAQSPSTYPVVPQSQPIPVVHQEIPIQQRLNTDNIYQSQPVVAPIESYQMQQVNENTPVQNVQHTNNQFPQTLQQTPNSGIIQHNNHAPVNYMMPANGQMSPWAMPPYNAYPMNPNAKADLIKYMRQSAMQFYGQYPSYPQMNWNPQVVQQSGSPVALTQNSNVEGAPDISDLSGTTVQPNPPMLEKGDKGVDMTTTGYETQTPTNLPTTVYVTSKKVKETFFTSTTTPLLNTEKIDTSNTSNLKASTNVSPSSLDTLTPHKNMTNEELQRIIRILLVPNKMKKLATTKEPSKQLRNNQRNPQRTAVSVRRIISPPPTPTKGDTRRPVSEMHIKMVNYAPTPSHGLHAALQKPLSEIQVKLVNYDQKIVDTFKSHISSPFATRSKWVSTPGRRISGPKIRPINTSTTHNQSSDTPSTQNQSKDTTKKLNQSNASNLFLSNLPTATSTTPVDTQPQVVPNQPSAMEQLRAQEDVKNHQKAVVRHTQMLHHVMGSLKNELNRFQGSVRRSRTIVPSDSSFPKPDVETMLSKVLGPPGSAVNSPGSVLPIVQKSLSLSPLNVNLTSKKIVLPIPTTLSPLTKTPPTTSLQGRSFPNKPAETAQTSLSVDRIKSSDLRITGIQNETPYRIPESKPSKVELSIFSVLDKARKKAKNLFLNKPTSASPTTIVHTTSSPSPQTTTPRATTNSDLQTTEKTPTKQLLEGGLEEQKGKLDTLPHQQLVKQQQILKEQHARLEKQRDLLKQQLKTLRALRGGPPLAVPETQSGLAVLLDSLQKSLV